jgi:hypothetical protein
MTTAARPSRPSSRARRPTRQRFLRPSLPLSQHLLPRPNRLRQLRRGRLLSQPGSRLRFPPLSQHKTPRRPRWMVLSPLPDVRIDPRPARPRPLTYLRRIW